MSNLTKKLLGLLPDSASAEQASDMPNDGVFAETSTAKPVVDLSGATGVGLHDAVLSGWFQNDSNEVFRGIPIGPGDTVVDVGCGDGGASLFCARRGAHVTVVDIDPQVIAAMAARLAEISPQAYATHISDGNPLPLADAVATRVLCTEVLEHVDDPDQLLGELVRIGKPGALYLLSVPDSLQENLQKHVAPPSYFQKPNHVRIIERPQFADMVTRAGLVIEEHTQYGFFWSIWWALFWACKVDLDKPSHPALDHWTEAWRAVLALPQGAQLKQQLDEFMPKSQIIVARKP
ncbi:class I SAM-dependent methyltransferase [Rhodanobacter sp. Col0626]|uniref:class I SAM-dependent methyltransferase n=1 Tax=Rhodanobacter sp. Col0626 TaxID=3415679 RepID=UPI003CEBC537